MPESKRPYGISEVDGVPLEIKYTYPDGLRALFANHFVLQQNPIGEFRLSFFDLKEPAVRGATAEERKKELAEIGPLEAVCVANVVMTKPRMLQVLQAIATSITRMSEMSEMPKAETDAATEVDGGRK